MIGIGLEVERLLNTPAKKRRGRPPSGKPWKKHCDKTKLCIKCDTHKKIGEFGGGSGTYKKADVCKLCGGGGKHNKQIAEHIFWREKEIRRPETKRALIGLYDDLSVRVMDSESQATEHDT